MTSPVFDEAFWNDLYGSTPIWSGDPNPHLVEVVAGLDVGGASRLEALDIGSGEGGDAIWLARQGFHVTGVDLSTVALGRAQDAAAHDPEAASRITWRHVDLLEWAPPVATFDLVSSQYMHLPWADMRNLVSRLAASVRSGGTLLVVGHALTADDARGHGHGHGQGHDDDDGNGGGHGDGGHDDDEAPQRATFDPDLYFTAESLVDLLAPAEWEILAAGPRPHPTRPGTDAVLHARRR